MMDAVAVDPHIDRRRNAIRGAFLSEFVDMFDIYLPTVVLAPVLFYFQPAQLSAEMETIFTSLVFISTLLGRPIGALLFGTVADRFGRRTASIYSVAGFGIITFLIALLPGYHSIGIASYWLLVILRFFDGICLGGGYTGAMPLAIEYARKPDRGFVGGLVMSGFPAAYVAINLVAMAVFALFPLADAASPYAQWGWRIPFVIGALLAFFLLAYYIHKVVESEAWTSETDMSRTRQPLFDLLRGRDGRALLQILIMMTGFWLTQNMITLFIPATLLLHVLHLPKFELTLTLLVSYSLIIFSYIGAGMLAQKIGRRRFFIIAGPLISTVCAGILYALLTVPNLSLPAVVVLVSLLSVLVTSPWGVIVTYINERFATNIRARGFGIGFSLSVVIPSFYGFYLSWLGIVLPLQLAPVALLCIGGIIGTIGAMLGPETRRIDI
jgi:MFS family permease